MSKMTQLKIKLFLGDNPHSQHQKPKAKIKHESTGSRKRCTVCLANRDTGVNTRNQDKAAKSRELKDKIQKSARQCQWCGKGVCEEHQARFCSICWEGFDHESNDNDDSESSE